MNITAILAHLPLFGEMTPDELDRITQGSQELSLNRGDVIFQRGDACNGFHVVVHGQVKLALSSPQGVEKVVELIGPGQSFGEAVMFMGRPYPVYAQALVDSLVLHINRTVILDGIENDPAFCRKMLAGLSIRLHRLIQSVESLSLHTPEQRVVEYLLQNAGGVQEGQDVPVKLPTKKNVIASSLNITPETFSRVLHHLTTAGLIEVDGKDIRIKDIDRLRASND